MPPLAILPTAALLGVLALATAGGAGAAPLTADECHRLNGEHKELVGAGLEASLAKGPEWARANLSPDDLARIRHFLEIVRPSEPATAAAAAPKGPIIPLPLRRPEPPARAGKSASAPTPAARN
jgi:hypothetical protein